MSDNPVFQLSVNSPFAVKNSDNIISNPAISTVYLPANFNSGNWARIFNETSAQVEVVGENGIELILGDIVGMVTLNQGDVLYASQAWDITNNRPVFVCSLVRNAPSGSGNVMGPASSTANNVVLFADGTGKVIKNGLPISNYANLQNANIFKSSQTIQSSAGQTEVDLSLTASGMTVQVFIDSSGIAGAGWYGFWRQTGSGPDLSFNMQNGNAKFGSIAQFADSLGGPDVGSIQREGNLQALLVSDPAAVYMVGGSGNLALNSEVFYTSVPRVLNGTVASMDSGSTTFAVPPNVEIVKVQQSEDGGAITVELPAITSGIDGFAQGTGLLLRILVGKPDTGVTVPPTSLTITDSNGATVYGTTAYVNPAYGTVINLIGLNDNSWFIK